MQKKTQNQKAGERQPGENRRRLDSMLDEAQRVKDLKDPKPRDCK